jgi:ribosome-associated toxin RatA of RatAB toxin-antitoxin module
MSKVSVTKEIPIPQKKFYAVIADYERYPRFIPEIKLASVKSNKPKRVEFKLDMIKSFHYVLEIDEKSPETISWKLVDSNLFKKNNGGWKLKEKKGVTSVTYWLDVEFGILLPRVVLGKMVARDLPKMIERFREEAERLS